VSDESPATAVVAAVKAAVPGYEVRDALVKDRPADAAGYLVVYCSEGRWERVTMGSPADASHVSVQISSFAPNRSAAGHYLRKVRQYLLANGVDVPGWGHGDLEHEETRLPSADADVAEFPLVQTLDQFSMTLTRGA
jgi:hypothetical protein